MPGRVSALPWGPGRTGLIIDLGALPDGFVDILILPEDPDQWPSVGHEGLFEILQHRQGQVRLFPTDPSMRSKGYRVSNWSREEWAAVTESHPVGSIVTGVVTHMFPADRDYSVRFDDFWSAVEYNEAPLEVGTSGAYVVTRHVASTRRILVKPA